MKYELTDKQKKKYTEEQVKQAIKYACEYQMGTDYQNAGQVLLFEGVADDGPEIKAMDILCDERNLAYNEIELKDIFE